MYLVLCETSQLTRKGKATRKRALALGVKCTCPGVYMSEANKSPVLIAGIGFFICLASFVLAALLGKSTFTTVLFYVGFGVGTVGVLLGYLGFRQNEK